MKKIIATVAALSISVLGVSSAQAAEVQQAPSAPYVSNVIVKPEGGISTQAYDELSVTTPVVTVNGQLVTVTVKSYGGTGYFSGTLNFSSDKNVSYSTSSGQGSTMTFQTILDRKGGHFGSVTVKSGSKSYTATVYAETTR